MDRDLSRSRAILIGNSIYQDPGIPDLPAAGTCVDAMAELLTGELCDWPADRITAMVEVAAPHDLARRVVAAVRDADDVLLVYYVGHGIRTSEGQLALALGETERDPEALPHTGMLYENLVRILRGCRARTKLVILDCCHAELGNKANYIFQSANLAEAYPADGLYFLGASAKDKKAKAPLNGTLTYFTDALVGVVRTGIPQGPPMLRLDQIFLELRARLVSANLPEPVEATTRGARQFPFARNAAPPETHVDPDQEVLRLLNWKAEAEARENALRADHLRELQRLRSQGFAPPKPNTDPHRKEATTQPDAEAIDDIPIPVAGESETAGLHRSQDIDLLQQYPGPVEPMTTAHRADRAVPLAFRKPFAQILLAGIVVAFVGVAVFPGASEVFSIGVFLALGVGILHGGRILRESNRRRRGPSRRVIRIAQMTVTSIGYIIVFFTADALIGIAVVGIGIVHGVVLSGLHVFAGDTTITGIRIPGVVGVIYGGDTFGFGAGSVAGGGTRGLLGGSLIMAGVVAAASVTIVQRLRRTTK